MASSIIRSLVTFGGAVALATALAAPPAFADDDDIKITSTSEAGGYVTVRGKNFPENVCAVVNGVKLFEGVVNNLDGTVTVDISGLSLDYRITLLLSHVSYGRPSVRGREQH